MYAFETYNFSYLVVKLPYVEKKSVIIFYRREFLKVTLEEIFFAILIDNSDKKFNYFELK